MCWLWTPGGPWQQAVEQDIDVGVSALWALREVVAAARAAAGPPASSSRSTPAWAATAARPPTGRN